MKKKNIVITGGSLVLALVLWQVFQALLGLSSGANKTGRQPTVTVALSPVRVVDLDDAGLFTGTLQPRSQYISAPKISGRLDRVLVNIGDPVRFNQLIAVLEDAEYSQQAERARAELEVAKATLEESRSSLEVARREFERVETLFKQEIASESDHDVAGSRFKAQEARSKVAQAQVSEKEAAWKEAQVRLDYTKIRAAWEEDGDRGSVRFVGERFKDDGAMLTPNTPIVSILDINSLIAVVYVIERDYPKVMIGMSAECTTDAYPDQIFTGRIARIAPLLRETSRQARVEVEIPNADHRLKPGMYLRATIKFGTHEKATVVPLSAVSRRDGSQGVFLADTAALKVKFIPVTLGITNGDQAEVLEPPLAGEVVSLGQHLLEDGASIVIGKVDEEN